MRNVNPMIPTVQRGIDRDIQNLLHHLPRAPQIVQQQFLPYLLHFQHELPNNPKLNHYLQMQPTDRYHPIENAAPLIYNYAQLLQPKQLLNHLQDLGKQFEADPQRIQIPSKGGLVEQFEKIDMVYPDYDSYYRMSKQQKSHLTQYHPKNKSKDFFTQPRFLTRIQQFSHFQNNDLHKGNILLLQYIGNTITSGKVHLVANQRSLQMWSCQSHNYYPVPTLTIPNEEEDGKKDDQKKDKQKEKEEIIIPTNLKLQFQHKFTGHSEKIICISMSQDQYFAVTGSADRTIRLWCLRLKVCLAVYRGHSKTIWDLHFSPSGFYFLSGSGDHLMILWKTDQPQAQRVYQHDSDVYKVSFAKDPAMVVSASQDTTIRIWSTLEATLLRTFKLSQPVINFSLGFSGAFLISIESDGRITLFNLLQGKTINSFYFHEPQHKGKNEENSPSKVPTMAIHDVCLSQDERQLVCICNHYIMVYNMQKLQKKTANNVYTFYRSNSQNDNALLVDPKEVLYMGVETNLTHCSYQSHNVLTVSGTHKT